MTNVKLPIVQIIGEHKKRVHPAKRPAPGFKRVQAIVRQGGKVVTRHCDTSDGKTCYAI